MADDFCTSFADPVSLPPHLEQFIFLTGSLFLSSVNPNWHHSPEWGVQLVIRTLTHQPENRPKDLSIPEHRDLPYKETMVAYPFVKGIEKLSFSVFGPSSRPLGEFGRSSIVFVNNCEVTHSIAVIPKEGETSHRHLFSWSTLNISEMIDRAKNPFLYEQ